MSSSELNPPQGGGHSSTYWDVLSNISGESGKPRLKHARSYFSHLSQDDLPVLQEAFQIWRDYDEYLLLRGVHRISGEKLHVAVKCSKRGNDVFSERLDERMKFLHAFDGITIFSLEDFENNSSMPSNLLWVTLTFNPALCSLDDAWRRISDDWNLWITNMRNKYGRIQALKFIEAFPNPQSSAFGYPHIHAMLLFQDHSFNAFPSWERQRDGSEGWVFRIQERDEFKDQGKWAAFSDIKAIHSGRALGGYLRKHCKNTHAGDDPAALSTQALLWLKKKKTFTMSGGFREALLDLISNLHNSKTHWAQKTLDGRILDDWIWTAHGVKSAGEVGVEPGVWVHSLDEAQFDKLIEGR